MIAVVLLSILLICLSTVFIWLLKADRLHEFDSASDVAESPALVKRRDLLMVSLLTAWMLTVIILIVFLLPSQFID